MVPVLIERRARFVSIFLLAAGLVIAGNARAQAPDRAIEFEDLGLTRPGELSARAGGLSGIVPTAGDVTSLVYNPAGLCRIKQRTSLLGLSRDSRETVTSYGARSTSLSSNRIGLLHAGAAWPVPVVQGSLVPAVAVHRMFVSDLDIAYDVYNPVDRRFDEFRLEQSGSTYAFALGFGIDLASVLSAGMSMSAFEGGYQALRQSHSQTSNAASTVDRYVIDDIEGDIDGVVARMGIMLYAHRHAHIGITVTTPTLVNHSTRETREITEVIENSTGSTSRSELTTATEYIIPYRVDGGIEIPWGAWLIVLQAGTCDWSAAIIDKSGMRLPDGSSVLGRAVDFRAGIEWTVPSWPLRVRAGVAQLPFAPDYLQADRVDKDQLERVSAESAPMRYSFGAGIAMKRTILIDAAFMHTRGERSSQSFSETREWSQIVVEGSYWF